MADSHPPPATGDDTDSSPGSDNVADPGPASSSAMTTDTDHSPTIAAEMARASTMGTGLALAASPPLDLALPTAPETTPTPAFNFLDNPESDPEHPTSPILADRPASILSFTPTPPTTTTATRVTIYDPTPNLDTVTQPGTTTVQPPPDLKARLKEAYDAITPTYNQWTFMHRAHRMHFVEALIKLLQADQAERNKDGGSPPDPEVLAMREGVQVVSLRGMQALEVGCGSGVPVVEVLLAKDMDVIGVDLSGAQLELARTHFPLQTENLQATWTEEDMMDLRYPPDEFDVIIGLYSLIHLPREEQTVFLHRMARWVKPDGLILVNFARDELEGEVNERWLGHEKGWMFWSSWGEEKSVRLIEELGFEVLVREVTGLGGGEEDVTDAAFVWVIARKTGQSPSPEPPTEGQSEGQVAQGEEQVAQGGGQVAQSEGQVPHGEGQGAQSEGQVAEEE